MTDSRIGKANAVIIGCIICCIAISRINQSVVDILPVSVFILPVNRITIDNCLNRAVLMSKMLDIPRTTVQYFDRLRFA